MANVSHAIIAKSDQLNFDDIGTSEMLINITEVKVNSSDQPVSIFYTNHNGKPYKPCKSMIRLICEAWGQESENWHGKSIKIYGDPSVRWAGQEIGGIRIKAFSDINPNGIDAYVALTRGKRRKVHIDCLQKVQLNPQPKKYPCPKCEDQEVVFVDATQMWTCRSCKHEFPPKDKS